MSNERNAEMLISFFNPYEMLRDEIDEIDNCVSIIRAETDSLSDCVNDYSDTLGPHKSSLNSSLGEIQAAIKLLTDSAQEIGTILADVADKYNAIMNDDPFANPEK